VIVDRRDFVALTLGALATAAAGATSDWRLFHAVSAEIAARRAAGISAKGERPDTFPFVVDLRGVGQFRELAERLERRGYTTGRIEKILGRNFLAFAQQIWGA
jgi:membrane dipeptidase